jgi:hypothetical protein
MKKGYLWLIIAILGLVCIAQFYRISTSAQARSIQEKLDKELRREIVDYRDLFTTLELPPGVVIVGSKETQWTLDRSGVENADGFEFANHTVLDASNMRSDSNMDQALNIRIGTIVKYLALQIRERYWSKAHINYFYNDPHANVGQSTISAAMIQFPHGVTTIIAYYNQKGTNEITTHGPQIRGDQIVVIVHRSHWVGKPVYQNHFAGVHFQSGKLSGYTTTRN